MIIYGDCLEQMANIESGSVNLVLTDPPYFRVKGESWDRAWDDDDSFLAWLASVADEWQRILAPNGSLYCFASPQMGSRVEVMLAERFTVLNHLVWRKMFAWYGAGGPDTPARCSPMSLRSFYSQTERVIFCEQVGADGSALRGSGYAGECQKLHAGVFEPLRQYLVAERDAAGITNRQVDEWLGTAGMAGHYFGASQWALPTEPVYAKLRDLFNPDGPKHLRREYEHLRREYEHLRREYEDLRREYEDLRRPFSVTAEVPFTDVWTYPTVSYYKGKHVCEKPLPMMLDIIQASSRSGDLVLDSFAGSGVVGIACAQLGREFIGIEKDEHWAAVAEARISAAQGETKLFT